MAISKEDKKTISNVVNQAICYMVLKNGVSNFNFSRNIDPTEVSNTIITHMEMYKEKN